MSDNDTLLVPVACLRSLLATLVMLEQAAEAGGAFVMVDSPAYETISIHASGITCALLNGGYDA